MKTVFIHITKSIPLLSQQRFPFVLGGTNYFPQLQKATPLLGFKTKGPGQAGWEEEDGGGQKEKKGDTHRDRKGE